MARALYGEPFLVVLDEPNSNLDTEGEAALIAAMQGVCQRDGIVVVVAHRPQILSPVDKVLVMREGRVQLLGPRDEALAKLLQPQGGAPAAAAQAARAPITLLRPIDGGKEGAR
jgi:ATP-binding cassette subfamily C protein